ncbi:MAG: hypothetical protein ABJN11_10490 [Lentilitoribacter sp.]
MMKIAICNLEKDLGIGLDLHCLLQRLLDNQHQISLVGDLPAGFKAIDDERFEMSSSLGSVKYDLVFCFGKASFSLTKTNESDICYIPDIDLGDAYVSKKWFKSEINDVLDQNHVKYFYSAFDNNLGAQLYEILFHANTKKNYKPFSKCIILMDDYKSVLENKILNKLSDNSSNIMVVYLGENLSDCESYIEAQWSNYPNLELSSSTLPMSFSHINLAKKIVITPAICNSTYLKQILQENCQLGVLDI